MGPFGIVLRARSIHTFGMRDVIGAVALDPGGTVVAAAVVPPRRVWTVPRAALIIEVPVASGLAAPGTAATAYRRRSRPPSEARSAGTESENRKMDE